MRRVLFIASAVAVSLPLYAYEVPISESEGMPPEIMALAQAEAAHQQPLKSIPAKQPEPQHSSEAEASISSGQQKMVTHEKAAVAAEEPAPLFQDDPTSQKMVQSVTQPAKPDVLKEMQALQNEIKQLRGQIEVQKHEMSELSKKQSEQLKQIEGQLSNKSKKEKEDKNNPDPDNVGVSDEPTADQESAKEDQQLKAYQEAFVLIREKKYAEGAIAMEAYLRQYPDSQYAPNAYYWLGELYMAQGFPDKGIQQFNLVVRNYPGSPKAPAAMLKLGYTFYEQSKWRLAREQFGAVIRAYPNTSEATLAKGRIKELDQQGL